MNKHYTSMHTTLYATKFRQMITVICLPVSWNVGGRHRQQSIAGSAVQVDSDFSHADIFCLRKVSILDKCSGHFLQHHSVRLLDSYLYRCVRSCPDEECMLLSFRKMFYRYHMFETPTKLERLHNESHEQNPWTGPDCG